MFLIEQGLDIMSNRCDLAWPFPNPSLSPTSKFTGQHELVKVAHLRDHDPRSLLF